MGTACRGECLRIWIPRRQSPACSGECPLYVYRVLPPKFEEEPDLKELLQIALVISWNLWQMDGFNYAIPYCEKPDEPWQLTIFDYLADIGAEDDFDYSRLSVTKGQELCTIRDWRSKETIWCSVTGTSTITAGSGSGRSCWLTAGLWSAGMMRQFRSWRFRRIRLWSMAAWAAGADKKVADEKRCHGLSQRL